MTMWMYNLVRMTRFRYGHSPKFRKPNNIKVCVRTRNQKGLDRISNISQDNLCLKEENISFTNNHIIKQLYMLIINLSYNKILKISKG
jgi:hypothetical protein